jgi:hypothetical protein
MAEARFNRDLRLASMQATVFDTSDSATNTITLPDDFRAVQSLRIDVGSNLQRELHPLPPERLADSEITTSYPIGYVTVGDVLQLIGGNGAVNYTLTYFQSIPSLTTTATTNWLLLREPALYLYGALIEASPYIGDDSRAATWATQYTVTAKGMQAEDDRARYGNSPSIGSPLRCPP